MLVSPLYMRTSNVKRRRQLLAVISAIILTNMLHTKHLMFIGLRTCACLLAWLPALQSFYSRSGRGTVSDSSVVYLRTIITYCNYD